MIPSLDTVCRVGGVTTIACYSTLNEFMSPKGTEFGYNYLKEICSPISLIHLEI